MEHWAGKAIRCSELGELFCRSFEDKNVKSSADSGGLTCEISEACLRDWKFEIPEESVVVIKIVDPLKKNLCFAGIIDVGQLGNNAVSGAQCWSLL